MDTPLFIRILELVREDIKTDADLHRVVENVLAKANGRPLTMNDYDFIADIPKAGGSLIRHQRIRLPVKFHK
jgi:hypothetical protein